MLLTIPYTSVQFVALHQCKQMAAQHGWEGRSSAAVSFTSGAVAGAAATLASYPFDLLRTTLAAQGEPKVCVRGRQRVWCCARVQGA
jgi:solute carrier family 25 thiamine pyrophosphate transporter 19